MILDKESLRVLNDAAARLEAGFGNLPAFEPFAPSEEVSSVLLRTAEKLQDNYPYFHPLYAGQMLKPPHPVARLAYALAMFINPNNHALDGGRATSALEKESVAEIAAMFGWQEFLGHLCGGGTMANLEALWVAGQIAPGKPIVASEQAHYTHKRISAVLQLEFEAIPCDVRGKLDLNALEARASKGDIGTVVATMGTTATGSVDPLPEILELSRRYGFRVHADAAYGGYFALASNLGAEAAAAFSKMREADSIVIDPHKHGLQPYGCGCVLFRDPRAGQFYKHESPYTYFSSAELHLGEISLECSRPGAAAAALWATQQLLPLQHGGQFAKGLERGREAALELHKMLLTDERFVPAFVPELDIVIFVPNAEDRKIASSQSKAIFDAAARRDLHLALADLPAKFWQGTAVRFPTDDERVTCLRSVLMKPEHRDWLEPIWERLCAASDETCA